MRTMSTLSVERCVACRRDSPRVTAAEIAELRPQIPDWQLLERDGIARLERVFDFPTFADALAFHQPGWCPCRGGGSSSRPAYRMGPRGRDVVDTQDPRAPPERLHHGREDRRAVRSEGARHARRNQGRARAVRHLRAGGRYDQRVSRENSARAGLGRAGQSVTTHTSPHFASRPLRAHGHIASYP